MSTYIVVKGAGRCARFISETQVGKVVRGGAVRQEFVGVRWSGDPGDAIDFTKSDAEELARKYKARALPLKAKAQFYR